MKIKIISIVLVIISSLFIMTGCHKDVPTTSDTSETIVEKYRENNPRNKDNYSEDFFEDISEIDEVVGTYQDEDGNEYIFKEDGTCEYDVRNPYDNNMVPIKARYTVKEETLYIDTGDYIDIYMISIANNTLSSLHAENNIILTKTSKE